MVNEESSYTPHVDIREIDRLMEIDSKVLDNGVNVPATIQMILNPEKQREHVKEIVKKMHANSGDNITDVQLNKITDTYMDSMYKFRPPKKGFSTFIAHTYVMRNLIAAAVGIPILLGALAIPSYKYASKAIVNAREASLERSVENSIESEYKKVSDIQSELERLSQPLDGLPKSESDALKADLESGRETLTGTSGFFEIYCPEGVSDNAVTRENYKEANTKLSDVTSSVKKVGEFLQNGREIVRTQERFSAVKKSLENAVSQIRVMKPIRVLSDKAETLYSAGVTSIEQRQLPEAEQKANEIINLKSGIAKFGTYTEGVERMHNYIANIARENAAKSQNERLYVDAQNLIRNGDVERLGEVVKQFTDLENVLNQEYKLELVNRPGIRTGVWTRDNNDPNNENKWAYYVVVEAIGNNGEKYSFDITDRETGDKGNVSIWGEHVSKETYERIGGAKKDNGFLDNSNVRNGVENRYFGEKVKGYSNTRQLMTDDYGRPLPKTGQIIKWENQ